MRAGVVDGLALFQQFDCSVDPFRLRSLNLGCLSYGCGDSKHHTQARRQTQYPRPKILPRLKVVYHFISNRDPVNSSPLQPEGQITTAVRLVRVLRADETFTRINP